MGFFRLLRFAILCLLILWISGQFRYPVRGLYIPAGGTILCGDRRSCMHETAHMLDREGGYISSTDDFRRVMLVHKIIDCRYPEMRDEYSALVADAPGVFTPCPVDQHIMGRMSCLWGGWGELYAEIFAQADGRAENMPESFRPFYDFERAETILHDYEVKNGRNLDR